MPPFLQKRVLPALLLLFLSSILRGQTLPPPVSAYKADEFGGHPQVFCAELLSGGQVVFGNGAKVLVYDGEEFRGVPVGEGKLVYSIDSDSRERIFVGGTSLMGVILPDPKGSLSFHSLTPLLPDSLKDFGTIWNTYCDGEGGVYFDALDQLFHYDGERLRSIPPSERFFLMHELPEKGLFIQEQEKGLLPLKDGTDEALPRSDTVFSDQRVMSIVVSPFPEKGKRTWTVFTRSKGAFRYHPSSGERQPFFEEGDVEQSFKDKGIYDAARLDPEQNPYGAAYIVGTVLDGVHLLGPQGEHLLRIGKKEGLPASGIWQLVPDERGNVWVGTENGIALLHMGTPFSIARKGSHFKGSINDLCRPGPQDEPPLLMATMLGKWVWREEQHAFERLPFPDGQCNELLHLPRDNGKDMLLMASANKGLLASSSPFDEKKSKEELDTLGKAHSYTLSRVPYPDGGSVFQAGRDGAQVYAAQERNGEGWEELLSIKDLPGDVIMSAYDAYERRPDSIRLWGTTRSKGAFAITADTSFTGYSFSHYDTSDGLPEGEIRVFPEPHGQSVLFGSPEGALRFEKDSFLHVERYGSAYSRKGRSVILLQEGSEQEEVWLTDDQGGRIRHFIPVEEGTRIDSTIFRRLELGVPRSFLPESGRTWIGGDEALAAYHPNVEAELEKEWHCKIRSVRGSGDTLLFSGHYVKEVRKDQNENMGPVRVSRERSVRRVLSREQPSSMTPILPYSRNRMEFVFAAQYPDRQDAVKYSYKLKGFDSSWSKWTKENKKEYTNLGEGSYAFKVRARNVYMHTSDTAVYRFRIRPPWFRTWAAYGGYGLAGISLIWFMVWLNTRRLAAQKERLEKLVRERTREIQEKNANLEEANEAIQREKNEVEKKNQALEEANETISQQKEAVEAAHREITQSIEYAQKIQDALLQSEEHVSPHLPEHFIYFKPQSKVSGDFYWGKEHKGYFYIAAMDCTGHGVPGAFMSMLGISQLHEIMNTDDLLTPGYILTDLRDRVVRELSGSDPDNVAKDGMDAAILRIPIENNANSNSKEEVEVQFAGAQNPLYVIRKGIAEEPPSAAMEYQGDNLDGDPIQPFKKSTDGIEIKGNGQPVGHDEYATNAFTTVKLQLQKNDMLYIFSDGYADQFGGTKGKKFRYGPFKEMLAKIHEWSLEDQKEELDRIFEDWKGDQEQIDDVVVVGVRL